MWKLVAAVVTTVVVGVVLWGPSPQGLPGLSSLGTLWSAEPALPAIDARRMNVAVARFAQDSWTESGARLVVGTFQEFPELSVIRLERTIAAEEIPNPDDRHAKALQHLTKSGADVVVWGVASGDDVDRMQISLTMSASAAAETRWRRYQHALRVDFPETGIDSVRPVLRLLGAQLAAESRARRGEAPTDELEAFIENTREHMDTAAAASWKTPERGYVWTLVGNSYNLSGTLLQDHADLEAAVYAYQKAIETLPAGSDPWARAQNNLGNVFLTLGARESKVERLRSAVEAYKGALSGRPRDRAPLDWAATQTNLGNALHVLGALKNDSGHLEEAVAAYRAALDLRTAETTPQEFGVTQASLGRVLQTLGEREAGTRRLEGAISAYYAALSVQSRKEAPLDWAATQNNLGSALQILGGRENNSTRLGEAIEAYRAALNERRRDRAPDDWATTQNNLGNALQSLSKQLDDPSLLREAVSAYRAALEERTRERAPLAWAETQNNLGAALKSLGEKDEVPRYLEEAADAYESALQELTRERTPLDWAAAQNNLGNVLSSLGEIQANADLLCRALRHHANAWRSFMAEAPAYAEVTADSLRQDRTRLEAVNTRQTRKCLGNYAEVFKAIDAA